jgi:hypothetical protein
MTVNYMMLTKDGVDLYADYLPFARGAGPSSSATTDKVRKGPRTNLISNPSFETNLTGWVFVNGTQARSSAQAVEGIYSNLLTATGTGDLILNCDDATLTGPGLDYALEFQTRPNTTARDVSVVIFKYDSSGALIGTLGPLALGTQMTGAWTSHALFFTVTSDTAKVSVNFIIASPASGEKHYVDAFKLDAALAPTITGVPADLAPSQWLFKAKGYTVQPRDIIAPTGFVQSVFRAVRDPNIFTDDSGNTLGTQVYMHGWVLGETLVSYLAEQNGYGGRPIAWPADGGYKVLPVTGTPPVNDGAGTYGFQSVTWPGSSVGVGTLRQVVSGDGGSTRQVAAILDLLAATTNVQRDTIESTYTSTRAAVEAARANLFTVASAATDAARRQFYARADLAWFLACQATSAPRGPSLENAPMWAMQAVVAKEAGLITGAFTTANYETMTQPIDAVLAMPSGY